MPDQPQATLNERLVVGITGRIGAGKTSAARYLSANRGFQYLRYSQVLSGWLAKDSVVKPRLQEVGWQVMAGGMQEELNRRLIAQIDPSARVVVDGLRHPTDYESLKKSFASAFHLLYIESPGAERWSRLSVGGRYDTFDSFERADSHSVEQQIEALRPNAEFVIHNKGSLQSLYATLDTIIRDFERKSHA